jgi:hypothetical protein
MNLIDTITVLSIALLALFLLVKKLKSAGNKGSCSCSSNCVTTVKKNHNRLKTD